MKPAFATLFTTVLFVFFGATAALLLIGTTLATHPFMLLFAILCIIGAAAIAGRPIVYMLTSRTGTLLFPDNRSDKPPPAYSTAEACRIKGDFARALHLYEEIVSAYPQELRAYVAIVEIALENVNDVACAKKTLDRGLAAIPMENGRRHLQEAYDEGVDAPGEECRASRQELTGGVACIMCAGIDVSDGAVTPFLLANSPR